MNSIIDRQFVSALFAHHDFQQHLQLFLEGQKPEQSVPDTTNDSDSFVEVDSVVTDIEGLLSSIYSEKLNTDLRVVLQNYSRLYQQLDSLRAEVRRVDCQLHASEFVKNLSALENEFMTIEQYRLHQYDLLEKVDVCVHRNTNKIQSIFTDKLNSAQMKIYEEFDFQNREILQLSKHLQQVEERVSSILMEIPQKSQENLRPVSNDFVRKLKNSKSIGSLLGFGS